MSTETLRKLLEKATPDLRLNIETGSTPMPRQREYLLFLIDAAPALLDVVEAATALDRSYEGLRCCMDEFPDDPGIWSEWIDGTDGAQERLTTALAALKEASRAS